ncbi:hypothetical protein A5N15_10985 [Rothia kristinae]|uniref:Uncharacterized protein n=1 Tax=Rothia kristinae TaxID=37923 RepID=A0A657IVI1_9MICC|nr:hypothetical protein A5N15_10985 [Rothia kristinae]
MTSRESTVSGTRFTAVSSVAGEQLYRRSSRLAVGASSPRASATHVQVCRVRRAAEHRIISGTAPCSSSHRPAAGACSRPRRVRGRSKSPVPQGMSASAWRMITRVFGREVGELMASV